MATGEDESCKANKLYIKFRSEDDERICRAEGLLGIFSGQVPVRFYFENTGSCCQAPRKYWAYPCERLRRELVSLVGPQSVVFK